MAAVKKIPRARSSRLWRSAYSWPGRLAAHWERLQRLRDNFGDRCFASLLSSTKLGREVRVALNEGIGPRAAKPSILALHVDDFENADTLGARLEVILLMLNARGED